MKNEPLPKEKNAEPQAPDTVCATCGNELIGYEVWCPRCGSQVSENTVHKAGSSSVEPSPPLTIDVSKVAISDAKTVEKNDDFFSVGDYVVDEKISAFKFTNAYRIFDVKGNQIGSVEQQQISGGAMAARLLLGGKVKAMQSFKLDIKNMSGNALATIERGGIGSAGGIWNVNLSDGYGKSLGTLRLIRGWKPRQEILGANGQTVAIIQGDWKGWNFTISDNFGDTIGTINKKWNGVAKEMFTTADKYRVSVLPHVTELHRAVIASAAITIDMVLKEFS